MLASLQRSLWPVNYWNRFNAELVIILSTEPMAVEIRRLPA